MRRVLLACLLGGAVWAQAAQPLEVCFNYSCAKQATVGIASDRLDAVLARLAAAPHAQAEREALARAVGEVYEMAGDESPIAADRAGNFLDGGEEGRMDCIDHSTTTTRILSLLASRGGLRFHRVLEPARRATLFTQHFSAAIEEIDPLRAGSAAPDAVEPDARGEPGYVPLLPVGCDCDNVPDDVPRPARPETPPPGNPGARFVIDSWFVEHGEPAVVLPLADWMNGEGPNVR